MTSVGTRSSGQSYNGDPAPFSDIVVPPNDYSTSAYLEPTPSRPSSTASQQQQQLQRLQGKVPTQHDSGVVEDLPPDFDRSISSSSSKFSPPPRTSPPGFGVIPDFHPNNQPRSSTRLGDIPETGGMPIRSKRPDSLATRGHEYEELPTSRQDLTSNYAEVDGDNHHHNHHNNPKFFNSLSSTGRSLPPMLHSLQNQPSITPSVQTTDSNDNLLFNSAPQLPAYRKRQNPLYDSTEHDDQKSIKTQNGKTYGATGPCTCLWWIFLLLTLIISLAGLCLSLYNYTTQVKDEDSIRTAMVISPNTYNSTAQDLAIQVLEQQNQLLQNKIQVLENNVTVLQSENNNLSTALVLLANKVKEMENNFSTRFTNVITRIEDVQLTPGPQGPSGVGNLSLCVHKIKSAGGLDQVIETAYTPTSFSESEQNVILGIECTTDGGSYANLVAEKHTPIVNPKEYWRYKCKCTGASGSHHCEMHYWQCPRIT